MRNIPNLTFIPAGEGGDKSSELVANHRIEELIATLSPHFDWIVIDSPPVLAFADAIDLARAADAVLLVARAAKRPSMLRSARRPPSATRASSVSCSMPSRTLPRNGSYYYYYGKTGSRQRNRHGRKDKRRQG